MTSIGELFVKFAIPILLLVFATSAFAHSTFIMNIQSNFDEDVIAADANIRAMLVNNNAVNDITESGAFEGNSPSAIEMYGLRIELQRQAWDVISKAVINHNFNDARQGLKALRWAFHPSIAGSIGSWPSQKNETVPTMVSVHNKSVFLYAAARSLHLLKNATFPGISPARISRFQRRVDATIVAALKSARWMATSPNTEDFVNDAISKRTRANQLLFIAMALTEVGILAHDQEVIDAGKERMDQALAIVTTQGVFPEGAGQAINSVFDSSYQTVSLEILARYTASVQPSPYKDNLLSVLQLGTDRFLRIVRSDGSMDTSKNSRTQACGERIHSDAITKGVDIDIAPLRIRYLGYLLDKSSQYNPIADAVMKHGQGYGHIGCSK